MYLHLLLEIVITYFKIVFYNPKLRFEQNFVKY